MNPQFAEFMENTCLALAREVPEFPTQMGMFEIAGQAVPQDYFTRIDYDAVAQRQVLLQTTKTRMQQFARSELDESEQVSADVLGFMLEFAHERGLTGTAGRDFLKHEYLIRPAVGLQSELPLFLTDLHPMRHSADAEDYLSRLRCIAPQLGEANRQQQDRHHNALLQPTVVIEDTIAEVERFIATPVQENILFKALADKSLGLSGLNDSSRTSLLRDATAELQDNVYPAYQHLLTTLREQAPISDAAPGVWRLPNGDAWYEFMLQAATTSGFSAAEIHEIGLEEIDRVQQEIIKTSQELGVTARTIGECLYALDASKPPPRQDTEENRQALVDQVSSLISATEPKIRHLFHTMPKGSITVKTIPRFAEANRNQSYQPPSMDGSRAGFFELNVGQLLAEADYEIPILGYHEIFPGHHLQITLAQETEQLPSLRRIMTLDAYIEGWAKYAETIPAVHGINNDPRFRVARMRRELVSTINLALDTGIHSKRWGVEQAVQFFSENSSSDGAFSRYIVHRSASVPAQMCSYKIGMMKMLGLRKRMESALGTDFDVRDFHHSVLSRGSVPLALLQTLVEQDIEMLRAKH